jgi:hypothetical protein
MGEIKMNNDGRYDVDTTTLGISIDTKDVFSKSELTSIINFNKVINGKIEFKANDNAVRCLFIEYSIDVNGINKPSGLQITEADIWRINVNELVFEFPTHFLKFLLKHKDNLELITSKILDASNYVAHGLILPVDRLLYLYSNYRKSGEYLRLKLNKNQ